MKLILCLLLAIQSDVFAKNYLELSERLAKLRVEVEALNEENEEIRRNYKSELRSLSMQKAELGSSLRKETIKNKELKSKITSIKDKIKINKKESKDIRPIVLENIELLANYIENSIPYRKFERLDNLESIKKELIKGEIKSHQALNRLWGAFEDEQRLTRENQVDKERVEIDGKKYLAEVLKIGSMYMYFRLENGKFGQVVKKDKNWKYVFFEDENQISATKELFTGIKKQVKSAMYKIPLASEKN